jgi:hypothetical protein
MQLGRMIRKQFLLTGAQVDYLHELVERSGYEESQGHFVRRALEEYAIKHGRGRLIRPRSLTTDQGTK